MFSVSNTVRLFELDKTPPTYVMETLSLGPRNPVIERFNPNDVLVELDKFLKHFQKNCLSDEIMTDINIKTLNYIKSTITDKEQAKYKGLPSKPKAYPVQEYECKY